jgi:site-specific recombinase XerD
MEFDYKKLAKEMLKHFQGNYSSVILIEFTEQIISYGENNRAKKTCEGVKLVCKKLLNYFPPNRRLDTIQLKDAENFLDSLKKSAPKGIYSYHRTLRAIWNKAKQWNYVNSNPFEQLKLKKRQMQKPVFVTEGQLEEIVKHLDSEVVKDVVVTAFYTGCRLGELVNLTWQDVNLKDDLLTIGSDKFETKTRRQRFVPIHQKVREIMIRKVKSKKIKPAYDEVSTFTKVSADKSAGRVKSEEEESTLIRLPDKRGFVFSKCNGFKFTGDYFSRSFKRASRQAGVEEEVHFHCLRHGAATRMIMNGAPLPSVQRILGHANIQTTMIYTHPDIEDLREAVNRL